MNGFYLHYGKRILDICILIPALILAGPLMILLGAAVYVDIGRPLFFRAARAGQDGRPFIMYKFRTMRDVRDEHGNQAPDEQRLTGFGMLLRKFSLDELPELLNILKGDMSLVGPRPLLLEYSSRYDRHQRRRLNVPQGLTGWAQINGRNAIGWNDKLSLDEWYVDHAGLLLDLRIMFLTAWKIITREGVSHEGYVNMPEFLGNESLELSVEDISRRQGKYARTGMKST